MDWQKNYIAERYNILLQKPRIFNFIIRYRYIIYIYIYIYVYINIVFFVYCNIVTTHKHVGHTGFTFT